MKSLLRASAFALIALAPFGQAAHAQDTVSASVAAVIVSAIDVAKTADLNFATIVTGTGAATAVLNPADGSVTSTLAHSGTPVAAAFRLTGSVGQDYSITLPTSSITITRQTGTETMTVGTFTLAGGPATGTIPAGGIVDFTVGATLSVAANQVAGSYAGSFDVTVQYQ